jgi:hypothetical protein
MRKIMNSMIKYPFESETRNNFTDRLNDLWRSRQEILREWCEMVLRITLNDQEVEEKEVDEELKERCAVEIFNKSLKSIEDDNREYALQFVDEQMYHRNRSQSPSRNKDRMRSRSREDLNRYRRRSRSRERGSREERRYR